jgi:ribonuclease HI
MKAPEFSGLVYVHADESCLGNQFSDRATPGAAAGLIEVLDEKRGWTRRDFFVSEPDTTNNRMAIRSATEALLALNKPCRVVFYSDSSYLIKGMSEWVHSWAKRGWKRKAGPIENLELWFALIDAIGDRHEIEWRWVRGHAGDPKNEYANELAVDAARGQKNSRGLIPSGFDAWLLEQQEEREMYIEFLDTPPKGKFKPAKRPPAKPMI